MLWIACRGCWSAAGQRGGVTGSPPTGPPKISLAAREDHPGTSPGLRCPTAAVCDARAAATDRCRREAAKGWQMLGSIHTDASRRCSALSTTMSFTSLQLCWAWLSSKWRASHCHACSPTVCHHESSDQGFINVCVGRVAIWVLVTSTLPQLDMAVSQEPKDCTFEVHSW